MINTIRSMARAFVLSWLFYQPDNERTVEVFEHTDLQGIPRGKYVVVTVEMKSFGAGAPGDRVEQLFESVEVVDFAPT